MSQSKILIVDDQQALRDTLVEIVEMNGFQACPADSYESALPLIDESLDIALLDIHLGGKTGVDILAHIRDKYPECPVIMMTGYTDKQNAIDALRYGAVEYLEKPINPDELLPTLKRWVDSRQLKQENQRLQDVRAMHEKLKDSEAQIRMANERLNFLLTSIAAVIYASDASSPFATTFISDNVARLSGYDAGRFSDDAGFRLGCVHPDDVDYVKNQLKLAQKQGYARFDYRFRHEDGHYFWVGDEVRLAENRHGEQEFLGFISDITRRKQDEEKIRQMAYTDLLTGLPNRSLYYDRLKQALAQSRRNQSAVAVLFMDLDFFKPINDELGHEWGDKALIEVGNRLRGCIRETDTVARVGGDEFSIVLNSVSSEQAACQVAEKVIEAVKKPLMIRGSSYVLGISIGIYLESKNYSDAETFMRLADDAMYRAKELGRNRYCVHKGNGHTLADEITQSVSLEKDLRQALEKNELTIHFQPKVDMEAGLIKGMHALLRWNRGDGELVKPDQFLPLAIKTGLIVPIGEWVLRRACEQNKNWRDAGLDIVPISVNTTIEQLRLSGFVGLVEEVLAEYELDPDLLELEISESEMMQHGMEVMPSLNALNEMGVKITIDNFGAGYFSLHFLKSMPVHELKINRSLISQIGSPGDSDQIANAIISMGHILNHQVVAEGVETSDQMEFLRQHASDGMPGYFTSPPVEANEITKYLKEKG